MGQYKYIYEYTDKELDEAVDEAKAKVPYFYILLKGIDAYFERRKRKLNRR